MSARRIAILLLALCSATAQGEERGRMVDRSAAFDQPIPPAAEQGVSGAAPVSAGPGCDAGGATDAAELPFRITIDGQPLGDDGVRTGVDRDRCTDVDLAAADVRIRFDPMAAAPALNAWLVRDGVERGRPAQFGTYSNYTGWIRRAEIRVFTPAQRLQQAPFATVEVPIGQFVEWTAPADAPDTLEYVLRVYDDRGRFDETAAKTLHLLEREIGFGDADHAGRERMTGWGENSRRRANIPVAGGTVTVDGTVGAPGETVTALGAPVPVDRNGAFATRQILPNGPHIVEVAIARPDGTVRTFRRNLSIADERWFYVAIGDLTVGDGRTSGAPAAAIEALTGDENHYRDGAYVDGRGAFYLRGKIKGEYLLKMSADTGEQPIEHLFTNFTAKDPRYLLRRIDPDRFYPVYGDDSTIVDDAPTQGKFYVRIERDDAHAMWGNFQTGWTGTELTQYSRGLYGAQLAWKSAATTAQGERRASLEAFAAEPGTLAAREEFRATGGSLYYLRQRDLTEGSERAWVEIRDRDTDFVIERRPLAPAQDYDVNYLQGRILLRAPLASVGAAGGLVQTATLNGHPVYLVVTYEYVPGLEQIEGLSYGAHASQWLGDHLRIGATAFRQGDEGARQRLYGLDATLRYKPGTYLEIEAARSDGAGTALGSSIDGGFRFDERRGRRGRADARRLEGALDVAEVWDGGRGTLAGYWQDRDGGYSAPGQLSLDGEAVEQRGISANLPFTDRTRLEVKADTRRADSQDYEAVEAALHHQLDPVWGVALGARRDDRDVRIANASRLLSERGGRTDLVARVDYAPLAGGASGAGAQPRHKPWDLYGYVQGTVSRSGERHDNDRYGLGGTLQATDRLRIGSEVSGGDGGVGARLSGDWRVDDRRNYYLAYSMETERPDVAVRGRQGDLTAGSHYRLSEAVALFGESRWRSGAGPESLTHAFGLDLAPLDRWTADIQFETGRISDPLGGDLERRAVGVGAAYKGERAKLSSAVEMRDDDGSTGRRRTWLMRNTFGMQATPAWRLVGKLNFSTSDAAQGDFFDGDFVEGVAGAAYRPIDDDRWNALFKYTYFHDLPAPGQRSGTGAALDYSQRSHVLSVDAIHDLRPWLSVGAKYGLRIGELRDNRIGGPWLDSRADLVVLRADLHWVREWDAVVELRRLAVDAADDVRAGVLLALYRHLGAHAKAGVGYNFTDFSDDLTDLSFSNHGWFVNVLSTW
ncbi:MAG: OmpA family protein [Gammaproteobacteria bacterium]